MPTGSKKASSQLRLLREASPSFGLSSIRERCSSFHLLLILVTDVPTKTIPGQMGSLRCERASMHAFPLPVTDRSPKESCSPWACFGLWHYEPALGGGPARISSVPSRFTLRGAGLLPRSSSRRPFRRPQHGGGAAVGELLSTEIRVGLLLLRPAFWICRPGRAAHAGGAASGTCRWVRPLSFGGTSASTLMTGSQLTSLPLWPLASHRDHYGRHTAQQFGYDRHKRSWLPWTLPSPSALLRSGSGPGRHTHAGLHPVHLIGWVRPLTFGGVSRQYPHVCPTAYELAPRHRPLGQAERAAYTILRRTHEAHWHHTLGAHGRIL
jgi:hypothetical protein